MPFRWIIIIIILIIMIILIRVNKNNANYTRTSGTTITRKQKCEEKQLTRENVDVAKEKKGKFRRETKSLLIAGQNNAIRTKHIKASIDKTQQTCRWSLCGERYVTINHILREYNKLVQKEYKTKTRLSGEGDPLGIVQETELWPYEEMVYV